MLVVDRRGGASHGSPRRWFWWLERQYQTLVGNTKHWLWSGRGRDSQGSPRRWLWGGAGPFSWQPQTLVVWFRGVGSHGSPRRWLWGAEAGLLMAVSDSGCGEERRGFLLCIRVSKHLIVS